MSQDIDDFGYHPTTEFQGNFIIFNEPDEISVLNRFFEHIREVKPSIFVTFNGDSFDWPFIETRAGILGINMYEQIGILIHFEFIIH